MNALERRVDRLERRTEIKPGSRIIYLTPNLDSEEPEESPSLVKLSPDVWAHIAGAPLNEAEVRQLRVDYEKEHRKDSETGNCE
jgi:hypothetical protein